MSIFGKFTMWQPGGSCFNFRLLFLSLLGNTELWVNRIGVAICIWSTKEIKKALIFSRFRLNSRADGNIKLTTGKPKC